MFRAESLNYFLVLGITLFLVTVGLAMVLSSSAVESAAASDSAYGEFFRQASFAGVGIVAMLIASRMPVKFWRLVSWPFLAFACFLQCLVLFTDLGVKVNGNRNWLVIGGFQLQPSELIKLALVLWLGAVVMAKRDKLHRFGSGLLPILLVGGTAIGLVLLGEDLGTVVVMGVALLGALFLIGVPIKNLIVPVLAALVAFAGFAFASQNRMDRIMSFANQGLCENYNTDLAFQSCQGLFTLASGGFFGVGLGGSQAKYDWLPEASNDFIFAIIGEETGLIGALVVILLFVGLAYALARTLQSTESPFGRAATAFVLVWVIGQACVNIGVVLGVFPVLGVPLPLVSAGGSALVTTLAAIGVVLSFAREASPRKPARRKAKAAA
ncbi:putative lipid II flippase FtsW [Agromyces seonyuensis]|uniref:Probable peptidoglycan glycosyltransferase FtsW n=1 Tax=Agromyces seonyuensis TaxID=2662446 RepID=A0A6I4P571_9MICO|nr:putative lipid II flippase FtsW [Agromyces seonyuensis]